jgi:hypothetical protein
VEACGRNFFQSGNNTDGIMNIGGGNTDSERKSMLVDHNIDLDAFDFLPAVDPALATGWRGAARPAVHDDSGGSRAIPAGQAPSTEEIGQ